MNVTTIQSTGVVLKWPQFKMHDPRSLLGYVVYSIEAPKQNITLYDGRDACGGDGYVSVCAIVNVSKTRRYVPAGGSTTSTTRTTSASRCTTS